MERQSEFGRSASSPDARGGSDELLRAVREAAAAEYDILGEMGRGERGSVVYLAREQSSSRLVALKLRPDGGEYELSVVRELDASLPAMGTACPSCKAEVSGWGRFCSNCGKDLSGTHLADGSRQEMLEAVRRIANGEYEVLGEMERPEGGGTVYFAREITSARLVALRVTQTQDSDGTESLVLGVTQIIKPIAASLGATYTSTESMMGASAPAPRAAAGSIRSPQPSARSPTPPSVIVPDAQREEFPAPAPRRRAPAKPIAVVAVIVLVGGALFALSHGMRHASDASLDSAQPVIVPPAAAAAPPVVASPESGFVTIGTLPVAARVTLNGKSIDVRELALLPGKYRISATAPGYRTASQRLEVVGGRSISWAPTMQRSRVPTEAKVGAPKPVKSATPDCLSAYSDKNWAAALGACTREANAGNQSAQRNLGVIYDQGLGTTRDAAQAVVWFRKAAETGNRDATYQLATMYENGSGVPQDQKQAIVWYRKAALLGDADSQVKLGGAYEDGKGVARNPAEAAAWFQRAADQGSLFALNRLGAMYADGKGIPRDEGRAVRLYQSAAARGDAQGQYNLATMYAKGRGIAKSDSTANELYAKSARQGYPDAVREAKHRKLKV